MKLLQEADAFATSVSKIVAFGLKYNDKLPQEVQDIFSLSLDEEGVSIAASLQYRKSSREKFLALIGMVFGTQGWTYTEREEYLDWYRTIDGVLIKIYAAEDAPPRLKDVPLPSNRFPIMLQNTEGVEQDVVIDRVLE